MRSTFSLALRHCASACATPASAAAIKETSELQKLIESELDSPEERELFNRIGELRKRPTQPFNGYADQVASM